MANHVSQSTTEIRTLVSAVLCRTSKCLTALLEDTKTDLQSRFKAFLATKLRIPLRISRDSELYQEKFLNIVIDNIGRRKFNSIIRRYAEERRSQLEKNAMLSPIGMRLIRKVIRNRLWEFIRARHRAALKAQLLLECHAGLDDSESDDILPEKQVRLEQSEMSVSEEEEPLTRSNSGMVLRNQRTLSEPEVRSRAPKPPGAVSLVLISNGELASAFKFPVLDPESMALAASDKQFLPKYDTANNSATRENIITLLNSVGTMNTTGSAMKGVLLRTCFNRVKLLFEEQDSDHFLTMAAPYIDNKIRLYTLLIDLSVQHQDVLAPIIARNRFHALLAALMYACYDIAPKGVNAALNFVGQKIAAKSAKGACRLFMELPWSTVEPKCFDLLTRLVVIYDFVRREQFTLHCDLSQRFEQFQNSVNKYETVLLALGLNFLAPEQFKNSTYPRTLALYHEVVWKRKMTSLGPEATNMYNESLVRLFV